jgi:hypothetical protein
VLEISALAAVLCLAAVLLFWNLGERYLWQDEANTAVLAVRMLKFGKPLSYDGVNLLTNDNFAAEDMETIGDRTADPEAALEYYVQRGDMKADTAWIYQPWGQFVVAAASLGLLGKTTVAARLPFALAALATVVLLYWLVRRVSGSALMAGLAGALLATNAYWILHGRQCRYYSLSGLFLVLTLLAYLRWQRGSRWGAAIFVVTAWCWFQVDYGMVWPVLGVLFLEAWLTAFVTHRRSSWQPLLIGVLLSATLVPFVYYYQLWDRRSVQNVTWLYRFEGTAFNINQYFVPLVVLLAAAVLLTCRWKTTPEPERRLLAISCAIVVAVLFWVPTVAPEAFVRYVVSLAPVGCLVSAWLLVRGSGSWASRFAWLGAVVLALTPWLAEPAYTLISAPEWNKRRAGFRVELSLLHSDIFGHRPDPNRLVVDWLRRNAAPTDEILINYEDVPLMFYLPNPIRGGIAAFRAEDDSRTPPRFAVIRRIVPFVHWPVFEREVFRYKWDPVPLKAPDVIWGNNPDPMGHFLNPDPPTDLMILRRRDN